jgi:hypothetical protein
MVGRTVPGRRLLAGAVVNGAIVVGIASLAVSSLCASTARADASSFSLAATPSPTPDTSQDYGLLQSHMRESGMGGDMLDNYGIRNNGYAEAGVTYNWEDAPGAFTGIGRLFDDKAQDPKLDQLSLTVSREAFLSPDRFDTGFTLQVIYGADVRYTHANGTNFYGPGYNGRQVPLAPSQDNPNPNPHLLVITPGQLFPENQIDVFQAFVTLNLPYQNGVLLTLGKFETPWGVEHVAPTRNGLYSHSYIFGLSQPFTLTGVAAEYRYNDQWSFKGGIVVGWDQSLQDENDFPSFFVQASYKYSDEWTFVLSYMTGPEKPGDRSDWRQLIDLTATWNLAPEWTLNFEGVLGYENDVGTKITFFNSQGQPTPFPNRVFTFDDAYWFGVAGYSAYKLDSQGMWTVLVRGEYFNDDAGGRQLITEVYEATLGLNIVPFVNDRIGKHLMIRPEVRYDWAVDKIFDGDTRQSQVTFEADIIFQF